MESKDVDVVYGYQIERKGNPIERVAGRAAYALFNALLPIPVPLNAVTVRLMRRDYVNSLLLHREQQTVIGGLWVITGYKQLGEPVNKLSRPMTTYSMWRRWLTLIDSITAFSETPLIGIFYLGFLISSLSALVGTYLLVRKAFFGHILEGWVSVMISVWFLGGILIFCVGIIGIYLSKIFIETKGRPYTIVRRVHAQSDADLDAARSELRDAPNPEPTANSASIRIIERPTALGPQVWIVYYAVITDGTVCPFPLRDNRSQPPVS